MSFQVLSAIVWEEMKGFLVGTSPCACVLASLELFQICLLSGLNENWDCDSVEPPLSEEIEISMAVC